MCCVFLTAKVVINSKKSAEGLIVSFTCLTEWVVSFFLYLFCFYSSFLLVLFEGLLTFSSVLSQCNVDAFNSLLELSNVLFLK